MRDRTEERRLAEETGTKAGEAAAAGAMTGGVLGGLVGLLAGVGALVIPGIGPIIAGGAIASSMAYQYGTRARSTPCAGRPSPGQVSGSLVLSPMWSAVRLSSVSSQATCPTGTVPPCGSGRARTPDPVEVQRLGLRPGIRGAERAGLGVALEVPPECGLVEVIAVSMGGEHDGGSIEPRPSLLE